MSFNDFRFCSCAGTPYCNCSTDSVTKIPDFQVGTYPLTDVERLQNLVTRLESDVDALFEHMWALGQRVHKLEDPHGRLS